MLLQSLITEHGSLQSFIKSLEPNYILGYFLAARTRAQLNFIAHLGHSDEKGHSLFQQLIEHPQMNSNLFQRILTLLTISPQSPQAALDSLNKGLSQVNPEGSTWASALLLRMNLIDSDLVDDKHNTKIIRDTILRALITEMRKAPTALFEHLLTITQHAPGLFLEMLALIINNAEFDADYYALLTSLHTPTSAMANNLYLYLANHPYALERCLIYLSTDRYGVEHAQKVSRGLITLLATPTDRGNDCFSIINRYHNIDTAEALLNFASKNFDAHKTLVNHFLSSYNNTDTLPAINQTHISRIFIKYLDLQDPDKVDKPIAEFIRRQALAGYCWGYAICYGAFNLFGKRAWWNDLLRTISTWDGSEAQLEKSYQLIDSDSPQTLRQLIERAMNYVISTQGAKFLANYWQDNYLLRSTHTRENWQFVIDIQNSFSTYDTKTIQSMDNIGGHFPTKHMIALFEDNKELIANNLTTIRGERHACIIFFDQKKNAWLLYDSNDPQGDRYFTTTEALVEYITDGSTYAMNYNIWLTIMSFDRPKTEINASSVYLNKSLFYETGLHKFLLANNHAINLIELCERYNTHECRAMLANALTLIDSYGFDLLWGTHVPALLQLIATDAEAAEIARVNLANAMLTETKEKQPRVAIICRQGALETIGTFINQNPMAARIARMNVAKTLLMGYEATTWKSIDLTQLDIFLTQEKTTSEVPALINLLINDIIRYKTYYYPERVSAALIQVLNAESEDAFIDASLHLLPYFSLVNSFTRSFVKGMLTFILQKPKYKNDLQLRMADLYIYMCEYIYTYEFKGGDDPFIIQNPAYKFIQSPDTTSQDNAVHDMMKHLFMLIIYHHPLAIMLLSVLKDKYSEIIRNTLFNSSGDISTFSQNIQTDVAEIARINLANAMLTETDEKQPRLAIICRQGVLETIGAFINQSPTAARIARMNVAKILLMGYEETTWKDIGLRQLNIFLTQEKTTSEVPALIDLLINDIIQYKTYYYPERVSAALIQVLNAESEDAFIDASLRLLPYFSRVNSFTRSFVKGMLTFILQKPKYKNDLQLRMADLYIYMCEYIYTYEFKGGDDPFIIQNPAYKFIQSPDTTSQDNAVHDMMKHLFMLIIYHYPLAIMLLNVLKDKYSEVIWNTLFNSSGDISTLPQNTQSDLLNHVLSTEKQCRPLKGHLTAELLSFNSSGDKAKLQQQNPLLTKALVTVIAEDATTSSPDSTQPALKDNYYQFFLPTPPLYTTKKSVMPAQADNHLRFGETAR